jgi:hypothetical protein
MLLAMASQVQREEDEPRTRGVPILSFLGALRTLAGYDAVNRMMGLLPPELRDAIGHRKLVSKEWYPLSWYRVMHAAAQEATGRGRGFAKLIGRETTRADFSGVNRVFLLVMSPQALIAKAPRVYEQYYTRGSVTTPTCRAGEALLLWRGCAGFDQNMWDDMLGSVEALLELAGGRDMRVEVLAGGGDKDEDMDMALSWT